MEQKGLPGVEVWQELVQMPWPLPWCPSSKQVQAASLNSVHSLSELVLEQVSVGKMAEKVGSKRERGCLVERVSKWWV